MRGVLDKQGFNDVISQLIPQDNLQPQHRSSCRYC